MIENYKKPHYNFSILNRVLAITQLYKDLNFNQKKYEKKLLLKNKSYCIIYRL